MNTLNLGLYGLLELGLAGGTWQEFVDHYNEKYDALQIDGFNFAPMQLSYTFQQLIAQTKATTLPAYVDPESPGYESALKEVQGITGNIPTMKKFYRMNRVILQEKMQLLQSYGVAAMTAEMQEVFMGLLDESTDGLIKSFYNALTHQRMQIVSTGKFTIDTVNNPRGLKGITIDFGIPSNHIEALKTTERWWTNATHTTANEGSASDPIGYIKNKVKSIRRDFHYFGPLQMEIAQDLLDDLLTHTKVLKRIGLSLFPNAASEEIAVTTAKNYTDEQLLAALSKLCGVTIVPRDTYAFVDTIGQNELGEPDLVVNQVESFKATNIAFVPAGTIGSIMGVKPLALGYDPSKVAEYAGGRLMLMQRAVPETHSIYVESESAQMCVPNQPQAMFISTVTA